MRLGRPISTPWTISNEAGGDDLAALAQVGAQGSRGGARGRVLDDTADRERIARPEPVGRLAPDELERRQVGARASAP